MLTSLRILLTLLFCTIAFESALAEKRFALVIGNGNYQGAGDLPNATADADLIAKNFTAAGFEVELLKDLSEDSMGNALDRLSKKSQELDVVAIYYAGHGIQKGGENYLVPIDAKLANETAIERETISLKSVIDVLERVPVSLLFLDACRNNPLANELAARSTASGRSAVAQGLAVVRPIGDMLITFATLPNSVALDGISGNSPFALALAHHMLTPNVEVSVLMKRITKDVLDVTDGEQRPQQLSQMQTEFYFLNDTETTTETAKSTPIKAEVLPTILSVYPDKVKTGEEIAVVADVPDICTPSFFNISPSYKITPIPLQFFKRVNLRKNQYRYEISPGSRFGLVVQDQDESGGNNIGFICAPETMDVEDKKTLLQKLIFNLGNNQFEGTQDKTRYHFQKYLIE